MERGSWWFFWIERGWRVFDRPVGVVTGVGGFAATLACSIGSLGAGWHQAAQRCTSHVHVASLLPGRGRSLWARSRALAVRPLPQRSTASAALPPHVHLGPDALRRPARRHRTLRDSPLTRKYCAFLSDRRSSDRIPRPLARQALLRKIYGLPDLGGVAAAQVPSSFRRFASPRVLAHAGRGTTGTPALRNLSPRRGSRSCSRGTSP